MNKFMKIGLGILALVVLYFVVSSFVFEAMMRKPVDDVVFIYQGSAVELDDELTFKLGSHDQRLKLGYVKVVDAAPENTERIQEVMTSEELSCSSMHMISPRDRIKNHLVSCNFSSDNSSVAEKLIVEGLVVEDCERSKNRFGTCMAEDVSESTPGVANYYQGTVVSVDDELRFKLDSSNQQLQLGLVTIVDTSADNLSKIEAIMKKYSLACTAFNMGTQRVAVDTVYCSTSDGSLSNLLMDKGLVMENCELSGNQFGTCTDSALEGELTQADLAFYKERVATLNKEMTDYQIRLATRNQEITESDENMLQAALELENSPEAIGTYKGREVELAHKCWGDLCPHSGTYLLRYVGVEKEDCEQAGGYIVEARSGWGVLVYGGCSPVERPISDQAY